MPAGRILSGLGPIHHRAYLVESIEETVVRLVDRFGSGPFFMLDGAALERVTPCGEEA